MSKRTGLAPGVRRDPNGPARAVRCRHQELPVRRLGEIRDVTVLRADAEERLSHRVEADNGDAPDCRLHAAALDRGQLSTGRNGHKCHVSPPAQIRVGVSCSCRPAVRHTTKCREFADHVEAVQTGIANSQAVVRTPFTPDEWSEASRAVTGQDANPGPLRSRSQVTVAPGSVDGAPSIAVLSRFRVRDEA